MIERCPWCLATPQYVRYHDEEWGRPCFDERRLFEKFMLETAQAGLSWRTILEKREGYRSLFDQFDAARIAAYTDAELEEKLKDPRIVRNRLKVFAFRRNAQCYLKLCAEEGGFRHWLWQWVDGQPRVNRFHSSREVPATTPLSDAISKALKKKGFTFVGSVMVYAWLQSMGVVNDHLTSCEWHPDHQNPQENSV
jgi:DNA-3-methyladenine glycosylase I